MLLLDSREKKKRKKRTRRKNLSRRIVSKVRKIFVVEDWFCTPSVSR